MNPRRLSLLVLVAALVAGRSEVAADTVGTAFTYQGQLKKDGVPVNVALPDGCDFEFTLWKAETGLGQVGPTLTFDGVGGNPPPIPLANGLFTTVLDFGNVFAGDARWLQIAARCPAGVGLYTTLAPRQELTPGPYALFATKGGGGGGDGHSLDAADGDPVDAVYVDNDGNVGIGTIEPGAKLDVYANGYPTAYFTNDVNGVGQAAGIEFRQRLTDSAENRVGGSIKSVAVGTYTAGVGSTYASDLALFSTAHNALVEGMRITAAGNVGIGTTAPGAELEVRDDTPPPDASSGQLKISGGITDTMLIGRTNSYGFVQSHNGEPLSLNPLGNNVGIGTTGPSANLEVQGSVNALLHVDSGTGVPSIRLQKNGTSKWGFLGEYPALGKLAFFSYDLSNSVMVLQNTGNVGIGTTTPGRKLHVNGTARMTGLEMPTGAGADKVLTSDANGTATWQDPPADSSLWEQSEANIYYNAGDVGIGTSTPQDKLHVVGRVRAMGGFMFPDETVQNSAAGGLDKAYDYGGAGVGRMIIADAGAVHIAGGDGLTINGNLGVGTSTPSVRLHVSGSAIIGEMSLNGQHIDRRQSGAILRLQEFNSGDISLVEGGGNVGVGTAFPAAKLDVAGTTRTQVLEITGGSDLAEPFAVAKRKGSEIKPGMVVVIDPENPGQLKLAAEPYDRKVAGIISGANGLNPGLVMKSEDDSNAHGDWPVALTGRVWCWCDASNGPIQPGDLLTTAATPGHAMKVIHYAKAQGAILGKAMTGLNDAQGLVLVLVSLQ